MNKLQTTCFEETKRLDRPGPSQWAAHQLGEGAGSWDDYPVERALFALLYDRASIAAVRAGESDLREACAHRDGIRERRLVDLANDLRSERRDAYSLAGLSCSKGGWKLEARHVHALSDVLEKSAQRRNLGRLLAHSDRLAAILEDSRGRGILRAADERLADRWGTERLLTWTILSRFQPISFRKKSGQTRCVIELLYMRQRDIERYMDASSADTRRARVDLARAIRTLNSSMGWHELAEGIPERLAMTQGDLRDERESDDSDDDRDPPGVSHEDIVELARRNHEEPGDEALWDAIGDDPRLHSLYVQARHQAELDAEVILPLAAEERAPAVPDDLRITPGFWERVGETIEALLNGFRRRPALLAVGCACALVVALWAGLHDTTETEPKEDEMIGSKAMKEARHRVSAVALVAACSVPGAQCLADEPAPERDGVVAATSVDRVWVGLKEGNVTLQGTSDTKISWQIEVEDDFDEECEVDVVTRGDTVRFEQRAYRDDSSADCDFTLSVTAPARLVAELDLGNGNARIAQMRGALEAKAGNGNVNLEDVESTKANFNLGNGNLTVVSSKIDDLAVESGRGQVDFEGAFRLAEFDLGQGSATLKLRGEAYEKLAVRVGMGNVEIGLPAGLEARINASSGMGNANSRVDSTPDARFQIEANAGMGNIDIERL